MRLPRPAPTAVDRFVTWFSPQSGLRRHHARVALMIAGGYTGARRDRRATQEWHTSTGSADADLLPDLAALRERSRDLDRNAPLARGAINTVVTNVVGTGLAPQPKIDRDYLGLSDDEADRWETDALRVWNLWCGSKNCDVRLVQDGAGQQELAFRSVLLGGDVFAVKRFRERPGLPLGFCWQFIEGGQP
jgi:capsid protein